MLFDFKCDQMVELYEENIEDWYMKHKDNISLANYLCEKHVLQGDDACNLVF